MESCEGGRSVTGWAARDTSGHLSPYHYALRKTGAEDVVIKVLYCGLCHTDLSQLRDESGVAQYPMVAGHEVVGIVSEIGEAVKKFKVGERVGVGCLVGSCGTCDRCHQSLEQYCNRRLMIFNDAAPEGQRTRGGFATAVVVDQRFVLHIPEKLSLEQAAPLFCAGVAAYSRLKRLEKTEPGKRVGVLGLGGVGHIGVKIAKALGLHVTVISTSDRKKKEALEVLGADAYVVSTDTEQMQEAAESLDYILDTIPEGHPLDPYLLLLKPNGTLVMIGVVAPPFQFLSPVLILGGRSIAGSFIGSVEDMQETLDFCAEKEVSCVVEVVNVEYINEAMERLAKNDVRYKFVLNIGAASE